MVNTKILPSEKSVDLDEPSIVEPLTREGCKRLPATERQIADATTLEPAALMKRAQQREKSTPEFLSEEALAYFIRRAIRNNDTGIRDALCRELFERCDPYFRGQFRGFDQQDRQDLQSEVRKRVIEDLFAPDDRGDFMQVRFWVYLEYKSIDACRKAVRHNDDTESLDTGYSGNDVSEGRTHLETAVDPMLSPEKLVMISEGLAKLPTRLQEVFLLRHYIGLKIGPDYPTHDGKGELTIAAHFGVSGRTIRNWLKEAEGLLAGFRGEA